MLLARFVVFSQATQLPRSKPRSGSPLPTTPTSPHAPATLSWEHPGDSDTASLPGSSTSGQHWRLWVTGAKVVSWTLIAWKGNPFQGPGNQYPRKPEETEEPGRPLGRAFAFQNVKLRVSRKPWYSAQTSYQPPAITTQN